MLTKLIKLDIKFAYKKFIIMSAILLIFGFTMPYLYDTVIQSAATVIVSTTIIIVCIMSIWLVIQHFRKNLFGPEGYLMFTLPVKPFQLLLSKLITTILWFNFMLFSAIVMSILLIRFQIPFSQIVNEIYWQNIMIVLEQILNINIYIIPWILSIYMGISLSTVAVRNKKLGIGFGIAISLISIWFYSWVSLKLSGLAPLTVTTADSTVMMNASFIPIDNTTLINLLVSLTFSTLFFSTTIYIMKHKLNLN